ncbi:hypothetical protein CWM53_18080 [Klebsiella sp. A-Nf5]|nr:hypothetical protein CWM61_04775 [Klebsiella sp. K-Nf6]PJX30935.1 hypothetical protein CWM53_18080 [Klebsiella sp. A-Nf5]PJX35415.1 hypothetical protein CWM59_22815 [Klebsiella sp. B-Nf7]PJX46163.1 hypothetical protein CWM60_22880 [Klebsiella sp. C1-16S-Nf17]
MIENVFCGSKDYGESDKQNAAQLPYPGCAGGISAVARRPDLLRCNALPCRLPTPRVSSVNASQLSLKKPPPVG